ncbi:MAG: hypothetical protein AAB290_00585, partial [Candidatus Eisenbacteria bacterium]
SAVVVFDGLSVRELPLLLRFAREGALDVQELGVGIAAIPSETLDFVEQRVGCGRVAPSQLPGRRELTQRGVRAYYYASVGQRHALDDSARCLLLWSAFPDNTYSDSGARFVEHFAQIQNLMQQAWTATVMALPRGRRVLVTSDHGYVFFGAGRSFDRQREELRPLNEYFGGDRSARISERGEPPEHADVFVARDRGIAMVRGRVALHPPGPAGTRLYKHGGMSLMEMLTPWLVLST